MRSLRGTVTGILLFIAACGAPTTRPTPGVSTGGVPASWAFHNSGSPVEASRGMVVSDHPLASAAGIRILEAGGNAIDAAVAVGFALAAVLPAAGNIGGGGFLVYRTGGGEVESLDYREQAPGAATHDMYVDANGNLNEAGVTGHLAVGVPGSVAGFWEMHQRFGRLSWREVVRPGLELAREHVVDSARHAAIAAAGEQLVRFEASRAKFLPGGTPPPVGTVWRQPELARTLGRIAAEGRDGFYRGPVADLIVAEMTRGNGIITHEDLAAYVPVWRTPIRATYRGYTIFSMPPSSSGGVTLAEILNIMEGFTPMPRFGSAALIHLEAEAMRRAFMDRNHYLGDPDYVRMPLERLLSKEYAARLRTTIDRDHATPTPPDAPTFLEGINTTHYSIVDAEGNAASVTTTINSGFGSKVTVTGAGFLLNNEMDDFTSAPGTPNLYGLVQGEANAIAPGKRMLSAMTPTLVLDPNDELFLVLGSPGGPRIISSVYHVISNVIDHGMTLGEAVAAPRIHHQALPDSIRFEVGGLRPDVLARLRALGHGLSGRDDYMGSVSSIMRVPRGWQGVTDPRRGGGARGY